MEDESNHSEGSTVSQDLVQTRQDLYDILYKETYNSILNTVLDDDEPSFENEEKEKQFKLKSGVQVNFISEASNVIKDKNLKWSSMNVEDNKYELHWLKKGLVYKGPLIRNIIQGNGILECHRLSKYTGNFLTGVYHGHGTFQFDKNIYDGTFFLGLPHGEGRIDMPNECFFKGILSKGKKLQGIRQYSNGRFIGSFDKNQARFRGQYIFAKSCAIYEGTYRNGVPHGNGILNWRTQPIQNIFALEIPEHFIGMWNNGKRNGLGILNWHKMKLITIWRDNKKYGPGLLLTQNGDCFVSVSMFQNDQCMNVRKVILTKQKILTVKSLFNVNHLYENHFHNIIKSLWNDAQPIGEVYPFHLSDFNIYHYTTPIWDFISKIIKVRSTLKSSLEAEFKAIDQTIIEKYFDIYEVYNQYASFQFQTDRVNTQANKRLIMSRLGLWQLMRDLGFNKSDIDISQIMSAAEEEFKIIVFNPDDFQEPVYFSSFLKYLLYLTMLLNESKTNLESSIKLKPSFFGYFATMFVLFLNNVLFKVKPYSSTPFGERILRQDKNLKQFLLICSNMKKKITIRTIFQLMEILKGKQDHNMLFVNGFDIKFISKDVLEHVDINMCINCTKEIFPQMFSSVNQGDFITNSYFYIDPLELFQLFEAILTKAVVKILTSKLFEPEIEE